VLKHGQRLVKSLLVALLGLDEQGIIIRNIAPQVIWYSSDYGQAVFCDFREASLEGEVKGLIASIPAPYGFDKFQDHNRYGVDFEYRDIWCIGMILLEIFVGSELVLAITSHEDFGKLFWVVVNYLDDATNKLLLNLLFGMVDGNIRAYIRETLTGKP
jgi:hypothetical protein